MSDEAKYPARRRRSVVINPELFCEMITTGWCGDGIECIDGLPEGAKIIRFGHDLPRDLYYFIVEHESFDLIPPFEQLPLMWITYSKRTWPENKQSSGTRKSNPASLALSEWIIWKSSRWARLPRVFGIIPTLPMESSMAC